MASMNDGSLHGSSTPCLCFVAITSVAASAAIANPSCARCWSKVVFPPPGGPVKMNRSTYIPFRTWFLTGRILENGMAFIDRSLFVGSPEVTNCFPYCSSERSRSRGGRCRVGEVGSCGAHRQINCGSQGGPCDPSTKNHAGGTPASSLL